MSQIAPARGASYRALRAVHSGRTNLPSAIAAERPSLSDERDRALAIEIATGTLRWRGEIDHLIAGFAKRPLMRLDPEVLDVLRLSIYQLLHLDRLPASAVVNDAVELTRAVGKRSAMGMVNAVLRSVSRGRDHLPLPPRPSPGDATVGSAEDYVSVTLSQPRWLASRWIHTHGLNAAIAWARFNNESPGLTLRVNRLKTNPADLSNTLAEAGVTVRPTRFAPDGLEVTSGNPLQTDMAGRGWFFVQDEASQLVSLLAGAQAGQTILDACASPGGKTTAIAAAMEDTGVLVATDSRARRMRLFRQTIEASGATSVRLAQLNLLGGLPFGARFDCVFVDAPCSGLGTIRRDPDIKWRRQEADLQPLADAELAMLASAAGGVRPGGRLVYATCSSEPEENESVVDRFLAAHPDFGEVNLRRNQEVPAALAPVLDDAGRLRTYPHVHGLEAFFGAVMIRRG